MKSVIEIKKIAKDCIAIEHQAIEKLQERIDDNFVAIINVGAYGASLSSNYNTRPLIAEILVNKNKFKFIRKKQNLLKLISA